MERRSEGIWKTVNFKIDSGADTSVISDATYRRMNNPPKLEQSKTPLYGPGGKLKCQGYFTGETKHDNKHYTFPIHVIHGTNNSLGRSAAQTLGLIQNVNNIDTSVFGSFGKLEGEPVKITLRVDVKQYCLTTARRVPFPLMLKVALELDRLEQEGIIENVKRPKDWCAPMFPVIKKTGAVRICVDLKKKLTRELSENITCYLIWMIYFQS